MKRDLRSTFNERQYMLSKDYEVYYYSDIHFHPVAEHTHDYYEFYLFLEGDIDLIIGETPHPLRPGDVVIVPPGSRHHAVIHSEEVPYRRIVLWISMDYLEQLVRQSEDYGYLAHRAVYSREHVYHLQPSALHQIQSKMIRLITEIHANRYGRSAALALSVADVILSLNRIVYEDEHPRTLDTNADLIQNLTMYIDEHLAESLTLEDLAGQFYLSKYYIAHVFKARLGISVHQYLTQRRLAACRDAIISGEDISKAFLDYGFSDYSNFYRAFRKEYGISPKECKEIYAIKATNRHA